MTSLIKNQILKHLTKFFKDLAPEQLQLSAFKGSCELSNLQLEEKVLMELLSFPVWVRINKATCDQLSIKIPWTKIKSMPIQMNLNEVSVEVEVCDEFRDVTGEDDMILASLLNTQVPGKYGFVDRVIDGITVTVNNVLITFKSKLMSATFNLSRVIFESRCPNWKPGELSLTRIKDGNKGQILLFKIVEWQTMRLEAKCLTDPLQAPLRLITNHAQCRLTIKKKLSDCSVIAARIFVIFEDILWVLTFAQFISAASFVEYLFALIRRSPITKKNGIFDEQSSSTTQSSNNSNSAPTQMPLISSLNTSIQSNHNDKGAILTGNMSAASLLEQKFLCYDLVETSLHLYIDKLDAHLYDDIEVNTSSRETGGALQTTFDQIQVDCYPYSRAYGDRKHWYRWFDPSPKSRKQWFDSHLSEFDLANRLRKKSEPGDDFDPKTGFEHLLSLTVLIKIKEYCMNCVTTKHSARGTALNKFIEIDRDYHMPSEMPALYLELDYFYYFDSINRIMIYEGVPDPITFIHLSPTKLLVDSPTLLFLNSFHINLSKALAHLNDLIPDDTGAPKIHVRCEILMPQITLPAKATNFQPQNSVTSSLLVKSGKVTLSNSIYDKNILAKLMESIDKLEESPSHPINLGGNYQAGSSKKDQSCIGDWTKVWNASIINKISSFSIENQLWAIQFEPVWMDFMNYDVDGLSNCQRLEPIVEPVNAYAFIHLNLSFARQSLDSSKTMSNESNTVTNKRDIISILLTVMEGSILANMDKVQFGFLQRLGMHFEKLLQQIKADASGLVQMDTILEDTLELNLTAYIKDIKARLILDKKVELLSSSSAYTNKPEALPTPTRKENVSTNHNRLDVSRGFLRMNPTLSNSFKEKQNDEEQIFVYSPDEPSVIGDEELDECLEVADDASCLFLNEDTSNQDTSSSPSVAKSPAPNVEASLTKETSRKSVDEVLLINLDEIEQSSALFAKMDLKGQTPKQSSPRVQPRQDIETESISYLELSMSQLMVRRITETKRRQKF